MAEGASGGRSGRGAEGGSPRDGMGRGVVRGCGKRTEWRGWRRGVSDGNVGVRLAEISIGRRG